MMYLLFRNSIKIIHFFRFSYFICRTSFHCSIFSTYFISYEKGSIDSDRLYDFLEKNITSKYKNKIIVLDNAGTHRCQKIKDLINENNKLIYSVPYQHYTNSIENFLIC
jgi:hypothetical protein